MIKNALYELEPIVDNPKFEGFAFVRDESLRGKGWLDDDFCSTDIKAQGRAWSVAPLAPFWTPQEVVGRVRPFNDYPCVNLLQPAFSRRAIDALRDFLEPNGELLPLVSSVGEYYAYNITTVVDILDQKRSEIEWMDDQHIVAQTISRFECFAEKMAGLSIFHIVEKPTSTFVTQPFVDRVREHGLQGFHFIPLWPLPEGVIWREIDRKTSREESLIETEEGSAPIKGNTVVLAFPLARAKPDQAEKAQLAKFMDELDSLLNNPRRKSRYYGNLEGDDHDRGVSRLFLSCPSADALVKKLRPWLEKLSWNKPIRVIKRYGEYTDPNCREEDAEL